MLKELLVFYVTRGRRLIKVKDFLNSSTGHHPTLYGSCSLSGPAFQQSLLLLSRNNRPSSSFLFGVGLLLHDQNW